MVLFLFFVGNHVARKEILKRGGHMLKGAQKRMIVVRTGDSRYFDEAYFVLRREIGGGRSSCADMLSEANRILEESGISGRSRRRSGRICLLLFLLGAVLGGGVSALLLLLLL